jgi:hypothetical protein
MSDPCRICDHPQATHGRRYTAGYGDHEWMRPRNTPAVTKPIRTGSGTSFATPSNEVAKSPIPHPLGGSTYPTDPHDPAGDRLFYGRTTA